MYSRKVPDSEADWEKVPQHTGQGTRRRDQDVSGGKLKEAGELFKQKGKQSASWERVTV